MLSHSLLLLSALLATVSSRNVSMPRMRASSSTLLSSPSQEDDSTQVSAAREQPGPRRRLLEGVTCTLFVRDVMYKPTREERYGHSEEKWSCEFDDEERGRHGVRFVELADNYRTYLRNASSGRSVLTIDQAVIDMDDVRMYLPSQHIPKIDTPERYHDRKLVASTGDLPTLMVRVVDSMGNGPDYSLSQLVDDVFDDESCLKTQMEACSYDQLRIHPYQDEIVSNGVHEITVPMDALAVSHGAFQNAMFEEFEATLGSRDDPKFGLIMFCIPPTNDESFMAVGWVNGKTTIYSHDSCGQVSAQMHEVGHNLNLEHSGEGDNEYADQTGVMGFSYADDDQKICYNAAKNWQLGWYSDQTLTNNPRNHPAMQTFVLNGISDYTVNPDALVVLRLEQLSLGSDFYIGYNRKSGINADTREDGDMVTVLRKDSGPDALGLSWKIGNLYPGMSLEIPDFNGEGGAIMIKFVSVQNDGRDAEIVIFDLDRCTAELCPILDVPCVTYTVEVKTDNHPEDTSWNIVANDGSGMGIDAQSNFKLSNHLYTTEVCLPYDTEYKFTISDNYGDGLCCQQGNGYYKVIDDSGNVVAEGDEKFSSEEHFFAVGSDPNPGPTAAPNKPDSNPNPTPSPSSAPTRSPTANPTTAPITVDDPDTTPSGGCEEYTVAITTDNNPSDTSWSILKGDEEVFTSIAFTMENKKYKTLVCLEYDTLYKFVLIDASQDGLCCEQGDGSYKVRDSSKNVIFESEEGVDESFHIREHDIQVGPAPPQSENSSSSSSDDKKKKPKCKDKKGKFRLKRNVGKKKNCKKHAKAGDCDEQYKGKPLWETCPKACDMCDEI